MTTGRFIERAEGAKSSLSPVKSSSHTDIAMARFSLQPICRHVTPCSARNPGLRPLTIWSCFSPRWRKRGGGGVLKKCLYESNHLPFYIPFLRKMYPFRIPSVDEWYPFHIPCLERCIPYNCCKCTVFLMGLIIIIIRFIYIALLRLIIHSALQF